PKEEGGLGIKSLKKWNEVLLIKQLWKIINKKSPYGCGWKKMLKLRNRIKDHVLFSTGNGESVSIWFDKWDLKGPLCDIIPRRYWYKERYTDNETVAAIPTLSVGIKDKVYWSDNQNDKTEFSTKQFWSDLRVLMRKWIGVMLFGLSNFNLDMLSCYGWE
ncbi:hypothetical protein Tco_1480222, partial [Tanacetum coccineum]